MGNPIFMIATLSALCSLLLVTELIYELIRFMKEKEEY